MNKTKNLIIVGAGETANLAYEYFTYDSEYEVCAFVVNKEYKKEDSFRGLPVVEFESVENKYSPSEYIAFVALAGEKLNRNRTKMYNLTKQKGYKLASYISSRAFLWHNVEVGENCFILEDNTLQPFTKIGNNVVLWSGNHIGHQTVIKDNCFITSHVVISGFCEIGQNSYLGVNSAIADEVKIAENNFIAMGAIISKNTKPNKMYCGERAKDMKINTLDYFMVKG